MRVTGRSKAWLAKAALWTGLLMVVMPSAQAQRGGFRGGFGGGGFRGGFGGGVIVGPAYGPFGYWGPYGGYSYYGGFGYPYGYGYGYGYNNYTAGQIKFDTKQKDAQIYLNGAYAGTVRELKSTWLNEGNYNLEIRGVHGENFKVSIYVVPGKTMHIRPQFPGDKS